MSLDVTTWHKQTHLIIRFIATGIPSHRQIELKFTHFAQCISDEMSDCKHSKTTDHANYSVSATPTELDILCYMEYRSELDINSVFHLYNEQPKIDCLEHNNFRMMIYYFYE